MLLSRVNPRPSALSVFYSRTVLDPERHTPYHCLTMHKYTLTLEYCVP
jgi:hypothetical protein